MAQANSNPAHQTTPRILGMQIKTVVFLMFLAMIPLLADVFSK